MKRRWPRRWSFVRYDGGARRRRCRGGGRGEDGQSATEASVHSTRGGGRGGRANVHHRHSGPILRVEAAVFQSRARNRRRGSGRTDPRPTERTGTSARTMRRAQVAAGKEDAMAIFRDRSGRCRADAALFQPPDEEQPYYDIDRRAYRNLPLAPYPLAARARLFIAACRSKSRRWCRPRTRSGIRRDRKSAARRACDLGFGFTVSGGRAVRIEIVRIHRHGSQQRKRRRAGNVAFETAHRMALRRRRNFRFPSRAMAKTRPLHSPCSPDVVKPAEYTITAVAEYNGREYTEGYHLAGYPGLRPYPYYRPATYKAVGVK